MNHKTECFFMWLLLMFALFSVAWALYHYTVITILFLCLFLICLVLTVEPENEGGEPGP